MNLVANSLDRQGGGPDDNAAQANHLVSPAVTSKWRKGNGGPAGDELDRHGAYVGVTAKCLTTSQERQDFDTQDFVHPGLLSPTLTAANNPSRSPQSSEVTAQVEATAGAGAGVRRLTPLECERLQAFPDGWTIPDPDADPGNLYPKPDGPRYAQMGNAVTVHCAHWLGGRLMKYGRG